MDPITSNTNSDQPASKRQKATPFRRTKTKSVRLQDVAGVSKDKRSALHRRSKRSRTTQSNTVELIDTEMDETPQTSNFQAETLQKPYSRTRKKLNQKLESEEHSSSINVTPRQLVVDPTQSPEQNAMYSSSLTALSDDEHHFSPLLELSSPESPPSKHRYISESTLVDLGELEGIVFEPQAKPSITPSKSTQSTQDESFSTNSTDAPQEVTDEEINLIYFGGDDLFQAQDQEEANLPAPHLSNEKSPCKCGCHEEMLVLKERIQKLEDLVFPEFRAIPPCCAAIISELP
ncbi:hypothetical protein DFH28DRAFT_925220 [Melampsora americana]|nr:hypothetical protein DFH28DRAFT_926354 [Melampsora americana]KAH9819109.1 hypothetical protein DFH28DRAFT_925220 [Melampsora americana]